jgi:hypothetical protein
LVRLGGENKSVEQTFELVLYVSGVVMPVAYLPHVCRAFEMD